MFQYVSEIVRFTLGFWLLASIRGPNRDGFFVQDYLEDSLEEVNRDLEGLTKRSYDICRVYITFETEKGQRDCLKAVEIGGLVVYLVIMSY